jgi:RimJ/RimL family protein N-acetyltransferase
MSARGRSKALIPQRAARSAEGSPVRAWPLQSAHPAARSAEGSPVRAWPLQSAHRAARSAEGSPVSAVCEPMSHCAQTVAPRLQPVARVVGKTLVLRDAVAADAAFIVALRTDPVKGEHLSTTPDDVGRQRAWLERYHERLDEAYFVIESRSGAALGTVRLYAARGDSFCWGSWILAAEAPAAAAIESALMVYAYALDHLGFASAYFEVQAANERVWAFHERFGAVRTGAQAGAFHYTLSGAAIRDSMQRYRRYLPTGVELAL